MYIFFSFIYSFNFFPIECQATCFKDSSYIFSKSGGDWDENRIVCNDQGGDLVSIETEEEWQFITDEIQKRTTSNTSAWHIGLWKRYAGDWTWSSGKKLSISKWQDSQPDGNNACAEISKNGGLFNGYYIFHNFCRACCGWDNLANGIFPCHELQGVITDVSEWIHALLNITHRSMYAQGLEYRHWRQCTVYPDLGW